MLKEFVATLQKGKSKGAWTYVQMENSVEFFKTKGLVKVKGTIDGEAFVSSFMAMGDGKHMLPVKSTIRKEIGKETGDTVTVRIEERIG